MKRLAYILAVVIATALPVAAVAVSKTTTTKVSDRKPSGSVSIPSGETDDEDADATAATGTTGTVTIPSSGDVVQVGDFQFVIVSQVEWERLQLTVSDLKQKWSCMNSNETGRVALHGRRGHTTVTNGVIMVDYEDGYRHVTEAKTQTLTKTERSANLAARLSPSPEALAIIRAKRQAARAVTNQVSVTVGGGRR